MPLSKDEQRRLDEIEQSLRDDNPLFAATVDFDKLTQAPDDSSAAWCFSAGWRRWWSARSPHRCSWPSA